MDTATATVTGTAPATATATTSGPDLRRVIKDLVQHLTRNSHDLYDVRKEPRHALSAPVVLGVRIGDTQRFRPLYRAWATDISPWGLGLLAEGDIPAGLELYANLENLAPQRCVLPIRVAYCQQLLANTYRLGVLFLYERGEAREEEAPFTD